MERPTHIPITFKMRELDQHMVAGAKTFSTKSEGFNAFGKLVDPVTGERYQVNVNIVRIGSKPK